ncbi:hypothetical protein TNCV_3487011 [Trichonephila clavipes]|nr:hypothetical protein TNCV_3487011 [Trichonephila clavipes]
MSASSPNPLTPPTFKLRQLELVKLFFFSGITRRITPKCKLSASFNVFVRFRSISLSLIFFASLAILRHLGNDWTNACSVTFASSRGTGTKSSRIQIFVIDPRSLLFKESTDEELIRKIYLH